MSSHRDASSILERQRWRRTKKLFEMKCDRRLSSKIFINVFLLPTSSKSIKSIAVLCVCPSQRRPARDAYEISIVSQIYSITCGHRLVWYTLHSRLDIASYGKRCENIFLGNKFWDVENRKRNERNWRKVKWFSSIILLNGSRNKSVLVKWCVQNARFGIVEFKIDFRMNTKVSVALSSSHSPNCEDGASYQCRSGGRIWTGWKSESNN